MAAVVARVNLVILGRNADLFYWGENVAAPMGRASAKDLPATLDAMGDQSITVEYHTISDPKARARDEAKFSKRLDGLGAGWSRSEWRNKTVSGYVFPDAMVCTLSRIS